ncbi:MAG: DUF4387 domain-containing protein [Planctomycetota bacterium]
MRQIHQLARVIRSKNAGPYQLSLDLLISDPSVYKRMKRARNITPDLVARAYSIPEDRVRDITYFDPACAIKIIISRSVPSGHAGDTDVYGAQQHAPLLDMEIELPD